MMPDYSKQQWDEMNKVLLWPGTEEEFEAAAERLLEKIATDPRGQAQTGDDRK